MIPGPIVRNPVVERWAPANENTPRCEVKDIAKNDEDKDERGRGRERIERSAASGSGAII